MTTYIIRRLLILPIILFGVTILIFAMLQVLGPVERSALYVRDIPKTDRQVDAIITRYGLDKPFYVQYWNWLVGTVDGATGERVGGVQDVHNRLRVVPEEPRTEKGFDTRSDDLATGPQGTTAGSRAP